MYVDSAYSMDSPQPASTTMGLTYKWIVLIPRTVSTGQQYNGTFLEVDRADTKNSRHLASSAVRAAHMCICLFSIIQNSRF